jgi:hypothetical protein
MIFEKCDKTLYCILGSKDIDQCFDVELKPIEKSLDIKKLAYNVHLNHIFCEVLYLCPR